MLFSLYLILFSLYLVLFCLYLVLFFVSFILQETGFIDFSDWLNSAFISHENQPVIRNNGDKLSRVFFRWQKYALAVEHSCPTGSFSN